MPTRRSVSLGLAALAACAFAGACGGSPAPADVATPTVSPSAIPTPRAATSAAASAARLLDWPEFDLDQQRSGTTELPTGITAANVSHLRRRTVSLPGTVDSSPVYVHGASVAGATHDAIVVTTTYGRTLALDAGTGATLWTFTPAGYSSWAGSAQITTTSPLVDPDRTAVYAASPNGLIHKLSLADGRELSGWPVRVTREPKHEKLAAALNVDGPDVIATTGGYFGDAPPYQGHVALIDRASGRLVGVFNTLCANRRQLLVPARCAASDSAILSRGGAVVEPGGQRLLIDTGNGPWNGTANFGDSVIELTFPDLRLRQAFTPVDQAELNAGDTDLGSSAPALLGADRAIVAGKDGVLRVLALSRLDGRQPSPPSPRFARQRLGGELQRLRVPGGAQLFTQPAVWRRGGRTTAFIADASGTAAYLLRGGRLFRAWENGTPGTSPVMAGGLLYVFDPAHGGIDVYRPGSPRAIAALPGGSGHWNSPIVVDGHVVEPEGDANDHAISGTLDIFSLR